VYKIGRTTQLNFARLNQYPKNSISYFQSYCRNCIICEKTIIEVFDKKYKRRFDIGGEYFEGDVSDMVSDMFDCTTLPG
jgi:T5orf172 domain